MSEHFFMKHMDVPSSVKHIMQELKVLLEERRRARHEKATQGNVTDFHAVQNTRKLDELIEQYQQLSKPVAEYFLKSGDDVTFRLYLQFKAQLDWIKETQEEKKQAPREASRGNVVSLSSAQQAKKVEEEEGGEGGGSGDRSARMGRRFKHLQGAVNDLLKGHLDADAIDHLMKHGNLTKNELAQLYQYIQAKKAEAGIQPKQEHSDTQSLGLGTSGAGSMEPDSFETQDLSFMQDHDEEALEKGLVSQQDEHHGKDAESTKSMAFGRSYREKLERLESKILNALNQNQFNPRP